MGDSKHSDSDEPQWEQALIDAYYEHVWRQLLDPLYEKFQQWKAGALGHDQMGRAIHETHGSTQKAFTFFTNRREMLLRMIRFDEDWYADWVKDHPEPPGASQEEEPPEHEG